MFVGKICIYIYIYIQYIFLVFGSMHFSKCSRLGLAWAHSANECWPTICEPQLFKIKVEQKSIATLGSLQDLNIAPVNHCDFLLDRIMIDRIIIGRTIINRIIELIKSLVWVKCRCWAFQWVSLPSYTAARQLNCDGPKELRLMKSLLIMVSERSLILERFGGKGLVYLDILDSPSTHETDYFTP